MLGLPKRFFRLKLDWQRFDEFAVQYRSWPAWKKWVLIFGFCIGTFFAPIAFYHNGVMSTSRFGVSLSIAQADQPILFCVMVAIIDIFLVVSLILMIVLFFRGPFRSDS